MLTYEFWDGIFFFFKVKFSKKLPLFRPLIKSMKTFEICCGLEMCSCSYTFCEEDGTKLTPWS